jgi:outer membrane immunogenic protein
MHRYLIASIALAFGIGAASAADLAPSYTKAPIAPPPPSWTGFYLGAEGGYGVSGDPTVTVSPNDPAAAGVNGIVSMPPVSFKDSGGFGGVTEGVNWQLGRSFLIGIETDFSGADIKGKGTASSNPGFVGLIATDRFSQKLDWFGTVRQRVGWLATDNLLLYGTGGFAYGRIEEQGSAAYSLSVLTAPIGGFSLSCPTANATCLAGNSSRVATGWTVGAGAEYRLPGTSASFKVEYLFVDLGTGDALRLVNTATPLPGTSAASFNGAFSQSEFHTVKAGLNWHF